MEIVSSHEVEDHCVMIHFIVDYECGMCQYLLEAIKRLTEDDDDMGSLCSAKSLNVEGGPCLCGH